MVERFNTSQSDVVVRYEFQGNYEETAQKLTAALAGGSTPDVCLLSDVWWFKFYLSDVLAPLNDLMSAAGVDPADYVDSLINEGEPRRRTVLDAVCPLHSALLLQQGHVR